MPDANFVLPQARFQKLLQAGVALQHIKDIISTAALALGGTLPSMYCDFKLLWLPGRVLRADQSPPPAELSLRRLRAVQSFWPAADEATTPAGRADVCAAVVRLLGLRNAPRLEFL